MDENKALKSSLSRIEKETSRKLKSLLKRIKVLESNSKDKKSSLTDEIESKEKENENKSKKENVLVRFGHIKERHGRKEEISIPKEGEEVRGSGQNSNALITCKKPFKRGSVNYFHVKCVKSRQYPSIGIVERYNSDASEFYDDESCVLGYYYYGGGNIGWCKGGRHTETLLECLVKWEDGEVIKVKINMQKWEISYLKNGKVIGKPVAIKEKDVYYAAVEIEGEAILQIMD